MKFKLQAIDDDGYAISHEFSGPTWFHSLDGFVKFLRGCGYSLGNKSVGVNEAQDHVVDLEDYDLNNIVTFYQE